MNDFTFSYPTKVYFGQGAAAKALAAEPPGTGKTVMLAYGGGSIKRSGTYQELMSLLTIAQQDRGGIPRHHAQSHLHQGAAGRGVCQASRSGLYSGGGRRQRH